MMLVDTTLQDDKPADPRRKRSDVTKKLETALPFSVSITQQHPQDSRRRRPSIEPRATAGTAENDNGFGPFGTLPPASKPVAQRRRPSIDSRPAAAIVENDNGFGPFGTLPPESKPVAQRRRSTLNVAYDTGGVPFISPALAALAESNNRQQQSDPRRKKSTIFQQPVVDALAESNHRQQQSDPRRKKSIIFQQPDTMQQHLRGNADHFSAANVRLDGSTEASSGDAQQSFNQQELGPLILKSNSIVQRLQAQQTDSSSNHSVEKHREKESLAQSFAFRTEEIKRRRTLEKIQQSQQPSESWILDRNYNPDGTLINRPKPIVPPELTKLYLHDKKSKWIYRS